MNTKDKGDISELTAILQFKKYGIACLIPYGDNEQYDFVVEINNKFYRVQVKTGIYRNGVIQLKGYRSTYKKSIGRGRETSNYMGKADIFAVCYENNVWIVPVLAVGKSGTLFLRIDPPKHGGNNQKNIKWAKDYTFEIQIQKLINGALVLTE